jgi:AAA domain/Protein kinase domain
MIADHYALLGTSARPGGLSSVRKGVDIRDGSFVAVKFIQGRTDELAQKVFDREVTTLRALDHPNIVRCRDAGIDETGTYYIVLDWVEQNLRNVLDNGFWDSWDVLWRDFARPLIDGLAYAHLKQIEHRDIKPQNVLVDVGGSPLLADFGIAKIRRDRHDHSEMTVGHFRSGPYAPPEMDAPIPYVRDVYSVGVLLLQCLSAAKIGDLPDVVRALEAVAVPPDVRKILERCVDIDPGERPRNASELTSLFANVARRRVFNNVDQRRIILLQLTNAAISGLVPGPPDRGKAIARLQADLSGEVFASFRYSREHEEHDRKTIVVVGQRFRYTIKVAEDASSGVLVAVVEPEFEALEALRRRSCPIPEDYLWTPQLPANVDAAKRGLAELIGLIDDHIEANKEHGRQASVRREGDELFDLWLRVLEAREDLARGARKPLAYKAVQVKGRDANFQLVEPTEQELIGTEWRVKDTQTGRQFGWGEVVEHDGDSVTLVGTRLAALPARASLVPHAGPSEVALQRQRDAVTAVKLGAAARPDLRSILLDPGANAEPLGRPIVDWELDLDQSKKDAVEDALGADDLLLIQGPPGTGKTNFIAETVIQTLRVNPRARILIASQTHVAVDNALERIDKSGLTGLVRLAGVDESRVDPAVRHLLLDAQTRKWAQGVRTRADAGIIKQATEAGISPHHLRSALVLQQIGSVTEQIDALRRRERDAASSDSTPSDLSTNIGVEDPDEGVQVKIENLIGYLGELITQAQSSLAGDLTISTKITASEAYSAVDLLIGDDHGRKLLNRLKIQAEWLQRIASDDTLAAVYLGTTSVVAGTCTGFLRNKAVRAIDFDLCIVDEASKATLTEVLVPLSRAKKWILVGDTNQLPPTDEDLIRATEILAERELSKEDVVETLFQRMADNLPDHSQRMLKMQYRMIRPIGDLISTCFYRGELQSSDRRGLEGYERIYDRPVVWLDTGPLGEQRRESAPGGQATSYANRVEAQLIVSNLGTLDKAIEYAMVKLPEGSDKLDVLVIAPYKSQVNELRRKVNLLPLKHLKVSAISVDSVQGREADVAFFSVTRSNVEGRLGFLGSDYWRRINVALSRARFGLVIVGDRSFVQGTTGALRNVVDYIQQHPEDCEVRPAEL